MLPAEAPIPVSHTYPSLPDEVPNLSDAEQNAQVCYFVSIWIISGVGRIDLDLTFMVQFLIARVSGL